jgi:hypothetical protein
MIKKVGLLYESEDWMRELMVLSTVHRQAGLYRPLKPCSILLFSPRLYCQVQSPEQLYRRACKGPEKKAPNYKLWTCDALVTAVVQFVGKMSKMLRSHKTPQNLS